MFLPLPHVSYHTGVWINWSLLHLYSKNHFSFVLNLRTSYVCVLFHSIMVDATISDLRKYMVPRYFTFEVLKSNFTARPSLLYSAFVLTFCFRTAKTLRDKGRKIDCTRGVSREQRAIIRRNKIASSLISNGSDHTKGYNMNIKRFFKCEY